jgi:hypothetical protein
MAGGPAEWVGKFGIVSWEIDSWNIPRDLFGSI